MFRAIIYGPLDGRMVVWPTTTLLLEVFTQRNFVADFIRLKLNFIENQKNRFEPPFGGLRSSERAPSIVRWKADGRLPIRGD